MSILCSINFHCSYTLSVKNKKVAGKNIEWLVDFEIHQPQWPVDKKVNFHPWYKASCYALRRAVRAAKLRYRKRIESHFQLNDSRRMWQGLKTICSSGNNSSAEVRADPLLAEELNTFYGRFECNGGATVPISASGSSRQSSDDDHVITVSEDEVRRELRRVNVRKAVGPDGITGRVLRSCADQLAGLFTSIFNESLATSVIPTSFKKSVIIPVPKNSKPSCLNDYRPVALTSTVMKVFERLLKKHICSSIPATLDPLQFAYRPNRSTDDAISQVLHSSLTHIDSKNGNYVRLPQIRTAKLCRESCA